MDKKFSFDVATKKYEGAKSLKKKMTVLFSVFAPFAVIFLALGIAFSIAKIEGLEMSAVYGMLAGGALFGVASVAFLVLLILSTVKIKSILKDYSAEELDPLADKSREKKREEKLEKRLKKYEDVIELADRYCDE